VSQTSVDVFQKRPITQGVESRWCSQRINALLY